MYERIFDETMNGILHVEQNNRNWGILRTPTDFHCLFHLAMLSTELPPMGKYVNFMHETPFPTLHETPFPTLSISCQPPAKNCTMPVLQMEEMAKIFICNIFHSIRNVF